MKTLSNILISHAIFLLLFTGAALALAQETEEDLATTTNPNSIENRESRQLERTERQAERAAIQSDRKIALQARVQERVTNLIANISNRIDAATNRLENIIDRLDSRIEKINTNNIDTTDAELALASAQVSIDAAKESMSDIDNRVRAVVTSDDFISGWQDIRAVIAETKNHLQTAKTELQNTVSEIKIAINQPPETNEEIDNSNSETN
jgi:chromosome segregation ATPase